jgi:ADP-ribosylglycohydrolase
LWRNPFREWIGAQIRGDFWGYAAPGNPELAADYAWRDASISHVKNGIYGAMWSAAMNSAAFVASNINQVLDAGLEQIPRNCRLADGVRRMRALHQDGQSYAQAVQAVHQEWDENSGHDWCHTISNAMIVTLALLWGEGDYVRTICRAVQACFDTDCNGATAGSIVGAMLGQSALPTQWTGVINDTVNTSVAGYNKVTLGELAAQTLSVLAGQA